MDRTMSYEDWQQLDPYITTHKMEWEYKLDMPHVLYGDPKNHPIYKKDFMKDLVPQVVIPEEEYILNP
jgi:hypothetical protein